MITKIFNAAGVASVLYQGSHFFGKVLPPEPLLQGAESLMGPFGTAAVGATMIAGVMVAGTAIAVGGYRVLRGHWPSDLGPMPEPRYRDGFNPDKMKNIMMGGAVPLAALMVAARIASPDTQMDATLFNIVHNFTAFVSPLYAAGMFWDQGRQKANLDRPMRP